MSDAEIVRRGLDEPFGAAKLPQGWTFDSHAPAIEALSRLESEASLVGELREALKRGMNDSEYAHRKAGMAIDCGSLAVVREALATSQDHEGG